MLTIGLTGGIACGKSTVSSCLTELGVPTLDADIVAREVVAPGSDGLAEIVQRFGQEVLLADDTLNRPALRNIILSNAKAKRDLEAITHPRIFTAMTLWQEQQAAAGHVACVVEAALMVETGSYKLYDGLIVATCSQEHQLQRLMKRNDLSRDAAQQWINSQLPLSDKERLADWVIENNGTLNTLRETVRSGWATFIDELNT